MNKLSFVTMITDVEGDIISKELLKLPTKGRMLELGTGFGHSALFFSEVKKEWLIYTIDGYGIYGEGRNLFNGNGNKLDLTGITDTQKYVESSDNIISIIGDTTTVPWELELDVLFIDADHTYEWVKRDTEHYIKFIKKGGLIIYHDYNNNWGVKKYFDKELVGKKGWKTWSVDCIAFAQKI